MIKLDTYNDILDWDDFEKVIPWRNRENWTSRNPYRLNEKWLKIQMERMINSLKSVPKYDNYGSRTSIHDQATQLHALRDLTLSGQELLTSRLPDLVGKLLSLCIEQRINLPSTIPKYAGRHELCFKNGQDQHITLSYCNLGPEWLRHFMGVLYDKDFWEEKTDQKYNPFRSRDHHVHSILVAAIGQVILSTPVDSEAKRAVENQLGMEEGFLNYVKTVENLAASVYRKKYSNILRGMQAEDWIREVWPSVALWHDCGYDTATWCLLTFREFAHCTALSDIVNEHRIIGETLDNLKKLIGNKISARINRVIDGIQSNDGYHHLWFIEEYSIQDAGSRPWGRFHALFSAYEFIKRFQHTSSSLNNNTEVSHLAIAIAEHHEPQIEGDKKLKDLGDDVLAKRFVENPMREILSFADAISGFARTEVRKLPKQPIHFGKIRFSINFNTSPLMMWKPKRKKSLRFQFFRKGKWEPNHMIPIRKSLWADFKENKRKKLDN